MSFKKVVFLLALSAVAAGAVKVMTKSRKRKAKKVEEDKQEAVTFAHLAMSLAEDYASVYYINSEDDSYVEYSAEGTDHKLKVISSGSDFFADAKVNCRRLVYEEDQELFLEVFKKETLMEIIQSGGTFTLNYRLVIDGKPQYFNLKTCRALDFDEEHIIIGVRNVDEQVRHEQEIAKALESAKAADDRDPLTGVKNQEAYARAVKAMDEKIAAEECEDFALVVCDVNGMKNVNDIKGLPEGDEHLKNACSMICRIFKHSPVYRIGGDEFAVVLTGEDYKAREILTRQFREQMKFNHADGLATLACGMAVYIPQKDKSVSVVFNRADAAMYRNKKQFGK